MTPDSQRLRALVSEEIRCAEAMLETLASEYRALADGNHDALAEVTRTKAELVEALERLDAERQSLAHAADADDWPRLRDLVARCKDENQRNGALLKARAENIRVALRALRGGEPALYGATGLAPARADARPLGTA